MTQADDADARPPGPSSTRAEAERPPASQAIHERTVVAIVAPFLAWAAAMGLAVIVRALLGEAGAGLMTGLLREGAVLAFLLATIVAVVGVLRLESRREET